MFIVGLGLMQTGLLLYFVLPAHSRSTAVLGWTRHDWGDVHFYCAMTLLALVAVHLFLNWNWVCQVFYRLFYDQSRRLGRGRLIAGAAVLLLVIGLSIGSLIAANAVKTSDARHDRPRRGGQSQVLPQSSEPATLQPPDARRG